VRRTQPDFKDHRGRWVQRAYVGDKYTWTISGVLWNNLKERCNENGNTQLTIPNYRGSINSFKDFQEFTDWHVTQTGYGLGYELDADICKDGMKEYSKEKCVLIPSELNRFLESSKGRRGKYPQGMYLQKNLNKLEVRVEMLGEVKRLGFFDVSKIEEARKIYKLEKEKYAKVWYEKLLTSEYQVDSRVIEHMRNWEHICDWRKDD